MNKKIFTIVLLGVITIILAYVIATGEWENPGSTNEEVKEHFTEDMVQHIEEDFTEDLTSFTATQNNWGIGLSVKNVTTTGMTLLVNQSGGEPSGELQFGSDYTLQVWNNDAWESIPYIVDGNVAWTAEAYCVAMDGTVEQEITWEYLYGSLPAGKYLLSKGFMDFRGSGDYDTTVCSVEFEIPGGIEP